MKNLIDKVAVVTGAAMGIGKCIAGMLMVEGCNVALLDLDENSLMETKENLKELGKCEAYVCDVARRDKVYEIASKIENDLGPVSILVNNAGIVFASPIMDIDDDIIEKIINVNLLSMFWTSKAFLKQMISLNEGHIVNMASAGGILAIPNIAAYCASKFGVVGFSDALRQEMKKYKLPIKVTYVCPNTVNTGMFSGSKMVAGTKMLRAEYVASKVIQGIKKEKEVIGIPSIPVKFLTPLTKIALPTKWMDFLNKILGMWSANDTWIGKKQ